MATWLDAAQVVTAIGDDLAAQTDDAALQFWCDGTRDYVEDKRRDLFVQPEDPELPPVFTPTPRVVSGAALLAYRLYMRRNTPMGVVGFDGGAERILRDDPDIGRMLGIGKFRKFAFGAPRDPELEEVV